MNRIIRLAYRLGYQGMLLFWWITRPHNKGALAAIWVDDKILIVKNSYRQSWSLPGGGIKNDETPAQAVVREVREELGLCLDETLLRLEQVTTDNFEFRKDYTSIFSVRLTKMPSPKVDRREVLEARFVCPRTALELQLVPQLATYLRNAHQGYHPMALSA